MRRFIPALLLLSLLPPGGALAQYEDAPEEEPRTASGAVDIPMSLEPIDSDDCTQCHLESAHGTEFEADLETSVHEGFACLDCHAGMDTDPHRETAVTAGMDACGECHFDVAEDYEAHGSATVGSEDIPVCSDCHGDHHILPSSAEDAPTHPANLPRTCGQCHENLDLTTKYQALLDHPIELYEHSIHGRIRDGEADRAASCGDCHATEGSAHQILAPGDPRSAINHFNIPGTCGRCHGAVEEEFWEGIHGQLVARGETGSPVCTNCHGEHGILPPNDPRSPVSRARLAEQTCTPCHESAQLNERYELPAGRLATFIDTYHGLKTKAGDHTVANCASCHGVHRILPSSDPSSSVHPDNLQSTCGECHPRISERLASIPIHGDGPGHQSRAAVIVERIYIVAIIVVIGLMVIHWLLDLLRQIRLVMTRQPQVRRMRTHEVWQHTLLMVSFIVLVISGFSLRFGQSWMARLFFGWEGGFELRGTIHRWAAVLFTLTTVWHLVFVVFYRRGRKFVADMMPRREDFTGFWQRILYNLGRRDETPRFGRFSYVEKAEYWALVWGTAIMILTGIFLWVDNWLAQFLPAAVLEVSLVVHYWEAWLATLAIGVWHLYSTVFNPHVYPMNPSWLTGTMPEEMYRHEHPAHLEQAKKETEDWAKAELDKLGSEPPGSEES